MATSKDKAAEPQKKYELLQDDTVQHFGKTLYRIRALVSFGAVVAGSLGGYIEAEKCLSHYGDAWVFGDARVSDNARVSGNARVSDNAWVSGNARVSDNAWVSGNAWVFGDARVFGDASIIWVSKVGSENGTLTVTHGETSLVVTRGCFTGSDIDFLAAVDKRHGMDSKIGREYALLIEFARLRLAREG